MIFPLPPQYRNAVSQSFGVRNPEYKSGIHNGVDYACPVGTPIVAPCTGSIYRIYRDHPTMGNAIYFKSEDDSVYFRFLHCSRLMAPGAVNEGQVIGYSGNTGQSTGAHCHIEAWKVPISAALLYSERTVRANLLDPVTLF